MQAKAGKDVASLFSVQQPVLAKAEDKRGKTHLVIGIDALSIQEYLHSKDNERILKPLKVSSSASILRKVFKEHSSGSDVLPDSGE